MSKQRFTWKKQANERGLAKVCQGQRGFDLRLNGEPIAHVRPFGWGNDKKGWYWYGCSKNTSDKPSATPEEAKIECLEHCKAHIAQQPELSKKFGRSPTAYGSTGCP